MWYGVIRKCTARSDDESFELYPGDRVNGEMGKRWVTFSDGNKEFRVGKGNFGKLDTYVVKDNGWAWALDDSEPFNVPIGKVIRGVDYKRTRVRWGMRHISKSCLEKINTDVVDEEL